MRDSLISDLISYQSSYAEEASFKDRFLELLQHPRCFHRDHLPGHITASAWIIDTTSSCVLLTLHAKLGRWLQPGGHCDGDEDSLSVAIRETAEETGIQNPMIVQRSFFDIDIHSIPARKDFPEHLHYDLRFLFHASQSAPLTISDESKELKWFPLRDILKLSGNSPSLMRMVAKTGTL